LLLYISETDLIAISTSEIDNDCDLSKPDDVLVLKEEQVLILEDDSDN